MNIKDVLQGADPMRHEALPVDTARVRTHIVNAARDAGPASPVMTRRVAIVAAAAVVAAAIFVGTQLLPQAAVRFEVRLAEDEPAASLRAARVANSDRTVYLHPEVVVTNADIADSRVVPGTKPSTFWIDVKLTPAGAQKMHDATANHIGKPVAILLDGDVVMVPTVRSAIGGAAVINGDYTRAEADRISNGMSTAR